MARMRAINETNASFGDDMDRGSDYRAGGPRNIAMPRCFATILSLDKITIGR